MLRFLEKAQKNNYRNESIIKSKHGSYNNKKEKHPKMITKNNNRAHKLSHKNDNIKTDVIIFHYNFCIIIFDVITFGVINSEVIILM